MADRADLDHFETLFQHSDDPWGTRSRRDEAFKRRAILRMLPNGRTGRILELGCGNGSNSVALATRTLRLDACDGAYAAVTRARSALLGCKNAAAHRVRLPGRFPVDRTDAVVIAELLYYLDDRTIRSVLHEVKRTMRSGGTLILCHHHRAFHDATQCQATLHERVICMLPPGSKVRRRTRTTSWELLAITL